MCVCVCLSICVSVCVYVCVSSKTATTKYQRNRYTLLSQRSSSLLFSVTEANQFVRKKGAGLGPIFRGSNEWVIDMLLWSL